MSGIVQMRVCTPALLVICTLALGAAAGVASTVAPMSIERLSDHAGQAFIGTVTSKRSYWAEAPRRIETEISFEQVEYLKGALPDGGDAFALTVPGGEVGETRAVLTGAPEFRVGETWVLLLLPEYKTHPVVGLHQGAFLVQRGDDGIERVYQRSNGVESPVVAINTRGFVECGSGRVQATRVEERLIAANGVRVRPARRVPTPAMTLDTFLAELRPVLAESRGHELRSPAGRRVPVRHYPVPLKVSATQSSVDEHGPPDDQSAPARGSHQAIELRESPREETARESEVRP